MLYAWPNMENDLEAIALNRLIRRNREARGQALSPAVDVVADAVKQILAAIDTRKRMRGVTLHGDVWPYLRIAKTRADLVESVRRIESAFGVSFEVLPDESL